MPDPIAPCSVLLHRSFDAVRASAGAALDGEAQPGPFDRLDWFEALHASAFPEQRPLIAEAVLDDMRAWLFLLHREDGRLTTLANWYSFVARPQFAGSPDSRARGVLISAIAAALRKASARLTLYPVLDDPAGSLADLQGGFRRAGWSVIARTMAHKRLLILEPGTTFADYWAKRPGALRATVRRKSARYPADITIHHMIDDTIWAALERVFAASWKPGGDDFGLLRHFAEGEAAAGRLRLGIATLNGEPAAVELWTVDQGRAYIHKLAYAEATGFASPGSQLSHSLFAHAIDIDSVNEIDFGTGDNAYKADWMPDSLGMIQLDMFDLRAVRVWPKALRTALSAARPCAHTPKTGRPRHSSGKA
jgi:Acetyltransferase (GNAT) domain